MSSQEQIAWVRDLLERIYDLAYLQRRLVSIPGSIVFRDGREVQMALLRVIQQIKPSPDVPGASLAWRIYNALDHRYVRALSQAEAASELNISLRQLRREQDRGIEAVANVLFHSYQTDAIATNDRNGSVEMSARAKTDEKAEFLRLDDLLHAVLSLIDPLLGQKNVDVRVTLPVPTPVLHVQRTLVRQLLIAAISRSIRDGAGTVLEIGGCVESGRLRLVLSRHLAAVAVASPALDTEDVVLQQLADGIGARYSTIIFDETFKAEMSLPVSERQLVLIIDDSADAIALAERYLERSQFDVVAVTRAEDALSQARRLQPDCILLDVMMPGRDGWEILALLKSHPDTIQIPVIVCSVLSNEDLAFALGATGLLSRPHNASQLIDTLQTAIAQPRPRQAGQSESVPL